VPDAKEREEEQEVLMWTKDEKMATSTCEKRKRRERKTGNRGNSLIHFDKV
jgi:hypothetical protein